MKENIEALLKNDSRQNVVERESSEYTSTKELMRKVCDKLSKSTQEFSCSELVDIIINYIECDIKLERILYSELTNYIYSLDNETRGIFNTNIKKLLEYVLNEENKIEKRDCRKIIIKLYDHSQLAVNQVENVNDIVKERFCDFQEKIKQEFKGELKEIEREYITILGIFSSIAFAFVTSITISSSVFQNMASVSIYKIVFIADLVLGAFLCSIHMLIRFIVALNGKNINIFSIWKIVELILCVAAIDILSWLINLPLLRDYLINMKLLWYM